MGRGLAGEVLSGELLDGQNEKGGADGDDAGEGVLCFEGLLELVLRLGHHVDEAGGEDDAGGEAFERYEERGAGLDAFVIFQEKGTDYA